MSIIIYSTPFCGYCQKAKEYFKSRNLSFQEIDISKDKTKAEEMIRLSGGYSVPVILINGQICVGWNQSRIKQLLGE